MPLNTLWESIVNLSGPSGQDVVKFEEAVYRSAVPDQVARVELRRMISDGLVEEAGSEDALRLTERGRRMKTDLNPGSSPDNLPTANEGV